MDRLSHNIEDYPEGIILPVDKPYRWTSADVIRKLKYAAIRHFGKKNLKVGHAGTLDPLATGILLVCIGPATRKAEELQRSAKQYLAGVTFGATTPSYDLEKDIDQTFPLEQVSEESIRSLLPGMTGPQEQVAPLFSAKSVDGVRAYELARRQFRQARNSGQAFNHDLASLLSTQMIDIYGMSLESFIPHSADLPAAEPAQGRSSRINVADISAYDLPTAMIRVDCSKGTYIRALARDLGEALGSGAFLSSLRRTANGGYTIDQSITLDQALEMLGE